VCIVPVISTLSYSILFMAANVLLVFLLMGIYGSQNVGALPVAHHVGEAPNR
jgi:hypothetical protein